MQNAKGTGPILHTTYMSPKCILEWKCTFVAARLPHQFGWGFFLCTDIRFSRQNYVLEHNCVKKEVCNCVLSKLYITFATGFCSMGENGSDGKTGLCPGNAIHCSGLFLIRNICSNNQ